MFTTYFQSSILIKMYFNFLTRVNVVLPNFQLIFDFNIRNFLQNNRWYAHVQRK